MGGGVEETLFLYLAPESDPERHRAAIAVPGRLNLYIVAVPDEIQAARVAREYLGARALAMIQLFGGFSFRQVARILEEVKEECFVGTVFFDEDPRKADRTGIIAILEGANPVDFQTELLLPKGAVPVRIVARYAEAADVAKEYAAQGIGRVELCGGFGFPGATAVKEAVPGVCVGSVFFPYHPLLDFRRAESRFG